MAKVKGGGVGESQAQKYRVVPDGLGAFEKGDVVARGDFPAHVSDEDFDRLLKIGALVPAE